MNDLIVLSLLLAGPKHGYRLKQEAALLSGVQQLHNNTVYPLLRRYVEQGWITQTVAEGERGQTRLLYSLTTAGLSALTEKLAAFTEDDATSAPAFRLRVGLFSCLGRPDRERILNMREEFLAARFKRLEEIGASHSMDKWATSTAKFAASEIAHEREWIAELMTQL